MGEEEGKVPGVLLSWDLFKQAPSNLASLREQNQSMWRVWGATQGTHAVAARPQQSMSQASPVCGHP